MRLFFLLILSGLCQSFAFAGGGDDDNVVIRDAKETYVFDYDKKTKKVVVRQTLTTTYEATQFRTSFLVAEFYNDYTTVDDVRLELNGKKVGVTPKREYYSVDDIFYSDARVCSFPITLDKKGSKAEVRFEKTINDPKYFTTVYFSDSYPIDHKTVEIVVPRWMKIDIKEFNLNNSSIKKGVRFESKDEADVYTFEVNGMDNYERENASPGPGFIQPHLLFLTKSADLPEGKVKYLGSVSDLYSWYHSLVSNVKNDGAPIKLQSDEIVKGVKTDEEKIKKIFYWVQDNIRYIAFEDGIAGFQPANADDVLKKKYGDCKGMAHLTKEMLKAQGFDARLCWIGTSRIPYDYSTPSIAVDNHMICALMFQGKTYFLDATEKYIGFNEYAERIQSRQVLIENGEKHIMSNVPSTTFAQNIDSRNSEYVINGTSLEGIVKREWKGEEKEYILSSLNSMKQSNSKDAFIKYLRSNHNEIAISDFSSSNLADYDKPVVVSYKLTHNNAVSNFGNELYLDLDTEKELSEFTFNPEKRKMDYMFNHKMQIVREASVTIPDGHTVTTLPTPVSIKDEDYEFSGAYTVKGKKLLYTKKLVVKNSKLPQRKFKQWNDDIARLNAFYNEQIVLTKKP